MKRALLFVFALSLSTAAFADEVKTRCGNEDGIDLSIVLTKATPFSQPEISTIDGQTPPKVDGPSASHFGPMGYENISLSLDGCKGTAVYSQFVGGLGGMQDRNLVCICN